MYKTEENVALIYGYSADIFYPIVSIIDSKGNELKEIILFELGNCVDDSRYSAKTHGTINENFEVNTKTIIYKWSSPDSTDLDSVISEDVIYLK